MIFEKLEIEFNGLNQTEKRYLKHVKDTLSPLRGLKFREPLKFSVNLDNSDQERIKKEYESMDIRNEMFPLGLPPNWHHRNRSSKNTFYLSHYDTFLELDSNEKKISFSTQRMPCYVLRLLVNDSLYPVIDSHILHSASFSDGKKSYVVVGGKNSGKTTLLLSALDSGFNLLSEDVSFVDEKLDVYPYNPDSMVWPRQEESFRLRKSEFGTVKNPLGKSLVRLDEHYSFEKDQKRIEGVLIASMNSRGVYNIAERKSSEHLPDATWKERMWLAPLLSSFDARRWFDREKDFWTEREIPCYEIGFDFNIPKVQEMIEEVT